MLLKNLFAEDSGSAAAFASMAMECSMQTYLLIMVSMLPQEFWEGYQEKKLQYEQEMQEAIQEAVAAAKKDVASRVDIYKQLKGQYDVAALKVMRADGDGTVSLKEFLAVFEPSNSKQIDFMIALGFMNEKEKVQYQQVKRMHNMVTLHTQQ